MTAVLACGIFVLTCTLIATERVNRVVAALGGAAALAVVGVTDTQTAFHSERSGIDWNVIFLLFGMMIVVGVLKQTGLFDSLAIWAAEKSRGQPFRLMIEDKGLLVRCLVVLGVVMAGGVRGHRPAEPGRGGGHRRSLLPGRHRAALRLCCAGRLCGQHPPHRGDGPGRGGPRAVR